MHPRSNISNPYSPNLFKDNDDITVIKIIIIIVTALLIEKRAMERILHQLTNIYSVLCVVQILLQDKPGPEELDKAIRVGLDGETGKKQDWPVTRVLEERNPKDSRARLETSNEQAMEPNFQPEKAEKTGRNQRVTI